MLCSVAVFSYLRSMKRFMRQNMKRTIIILLVSALVVLVGCRGKGTAETGKKVTIDSLTSVLYDLMSDHPKKALSMVDSLEKEGIYSGGMANCRRAQIYSEQYQPRLSGIYARRALDDEKFKRRHGDYYFAYNLLINSALNVGDMERGLKYATEAMAATRTDSTRSAREYAPDFMASIANCQMKLSHRKEGNESYERAWQMYEEILQGAKSFSWFYPELMLTIDAIEDNSSHRDFQTAQQWLPRLQSSYERTVGTADIPAHVKDDCTADMEMSLAKYYLREGNRIEAEQHYNAFQTTNFAHTTMGRRAASFYLLLGERWKELESAVASADSFYTENDQTHSMSYLTNVLARRFLAEEKLGKNSAALQTASKLINLLDTVEEKIDKDNTAELAVVYETQEKEQKIAQQGADLIRQRLIAMAVAFALVVLFFIIYTFNRRAAARRLAVVSAQKERIDSELRIARDIQMSMVPGVFPQRKELDMYASMTPAKEVGGDLYGYLMLGDNLYFAIGDVSGKGVPASLFMAQATRLFLTLSKQGMMPDEICTRMNDALSGEDNKNGMFVTFFLGMVNLTTGHLDFCNAGHNPPVIGGGETHGEFLKMKPNAPIGLFPGLEYEGEEIKSIKGHPFFVYTDGLNEAENTEQEQFGDERLLDILRHTHFDTAQQVIETLKTAVETHRNGADPNDDLTMMCLRVS